jgi:hypothetical protein
MRRFYLVAAGFAAVLVATIVVLASYVPPMEPPGPRTWRRMRALQDAVAATDPTALSARHDAESRGQTHNVGCEVLVAHGVADALRDERGAMSDTDDDGRLEVADAWGNPLVVTSRTWSVPPSSAVRCMSGVLEEVTVPSDRIGAGAWVVLSLGADGVPSDDDLRLAW